MARGKHAARRAAAEQRKIENLSELVAGARRRLETAEQHEHALRQLEDDLRDESAAQLDESRARQVQLLDTSTALTVSVGDLEHAVDELDQAWQKLRRKLSGCLGSSNAASSLLTGTPTLSLNALDGARADAPAAVLKAHAGDFLPARYTGTVNPLSWFADWLPEPAHYIGAEARRIDPLTVRGVESGVELPEWIRSSMRELTPLVHAVAASTIDSFEPLCLAAWYPLPWLAADPDQDDGQAHEQALNAALGATPGLNPDQRPAAREPEHAIGERERDWTAHQRRLRQTGRLPTPWAPRPAFPRPADADALQCWYRRSAVGEWAAISTFSMALREFHRQNPELGERRDLRAETSLAQLMTERLDDAGLYWLPPGHAAAHAGGEPLTAEALPELRLPYPSVLLTFAEPLVLPPVATTTTADAYQRKLTRARSGLPDAGQPPTWKAWTAANVYTPEDAHRASSFPTLCELLAHQGALVEGLLLLGDANGQPLDLFAWCLAVPDQETEQIFTRVVVPAERSRTAYSDVVNNLIAVVGWAEWHPPAPSIDGTSPIEGNPHHGHRHRHVYVLRTGRGGSWMRTSGEGVHAPRGPVRAHRRRAHWRRQHHGPGNQLVKRIRIGPIIVNAHAGPRSVQIYRLPAVDARQTITSPDEPQLQSCPGPAGDTRAPQGLPRVAGAEYAPGYSLGEGDQ